MKDKIILTVKGLNQAIYTLRNKGYSNDNICIYLTKETIREYAKTMPINSSVIFNFTKIFENENIRYDGIPVKLHYENKVVGIAEEFKL
ncbi:hypothetical protein [Methanobrevibacter sp.]|uniref:hypothetical protein n=1 Tax=Methanobrevibacter sp. TaxID=66852 RepID=UPI00386A3E0F